MTTFNIEKFVKHEGNFTTKLGNKVRFVCFCRNTPDTMLVSVTPIAFGEPENVRYCTDGNKYKGYESQYSIIEAA